MAGVGAQEMGDGTNMLLLTFRGPDPTLAADVANALTDAYYEQSRESKAEEATMMLRFIDQKLGGLAQRSLIQKISDLETALGESSRRLKKVPEEELELVRLSRSNHVNAELYSYLLRRQQETRIKVAATTGNVEIIDRAQVPLTPVQPNKKKNLALGLILGMMLGVGLAFLLDYIDRTVKDEDDVKESWVLPCWAPFPRSPGMKRTVLIR